MTDTTETLAELRAEAAALGINYSNAAKEDRLRELIAEARSNGVTTQNAQQSAPTPRVVANPSVAARQEAAKLVRIRVTCRNPEKKGWHGEVFTAGNRIVGIHKKFVPFNGSLDGWHVPNVIYKMMLEKKYMHMVEKENPVTKRKYVEKSWEDEFIIEVLPQLSQEQLDDLRAAQAANHSIDK